jgi:hypothetical protein
MLGGRMRKARIFSGKYGASQIVIGCDVVEGEGARLKVWVVKGSSVGKFSNRVGIACEGGIVAVEIGVARAQPAKRKMKIKINKMKR